MIEHVRRRILLTNTNFKVYVATCDKKIEDIINSYGGNVINTSRNHTNGTSRVCEAINKIDCTHVILVQGDEPLILPKQINKFYTRILNDNNNYIWNATSKINKIFFNKHSFVKCLVNNKGNISELFRKYSDLNNSVKSYQKNNIRKILGLIGFKREVLDKYSYFIKSKKEVSLSIEQLRYLENGYSINSVAINKSLPSINESSDIKVVINELNNNYHQRKILKIIKNYKF